MEKFKENDYNRQWKNILDIDVLRGNINLIAMFIMVYELLEDIILSKPKDYYTLIDFDEKAKREYDEKVLSLYDKRAFPDLKTGNKALVASLIWFKNCGAIDDKDIKVFTDSRALRNEITHEMISSVTEGTDNIADQFVFMYGLFCKIEKWWIIEYEIPINGEYKPEDIDLEGVMSGNMVLLDIIIDILANNSNAHFKEACEKIGIPIK